MRTRIGEKPEAQGWYGNVQP